MPHGRIAELFKTEYGRLVSYTRGLLSQAADLDAEDVVQSVLVQVLDRSDPSVPLENLAAYVYAALRNRVVDHFRRRRPEESLDAERGPEGAGLTLRDLLWDQHADALTVLEDREWRLALFKAIRALSETEQDVLIATEFEGRKFRELSEEWGVPLNTLLSRKARALKKLNQALVAWRTA